MRKVIDASAARRNWRLLRRRATARRMLAVVKSDAYGHGLATIAAALADDADGFAVGRMEEAKMLRAVGHRGLILLLSGAFSESDIPIIVELSLAPVVHAPWQLDALSAAPSSARLTAFLKVNTGMNRLGFELEEADAALRRLRRTPAIREAVLMTHFANADSPGGIAPALARFSPLRAACRLPVSLGNSAATIFGGDLADDWARVGIALYGASPAPSWRTRDELGLSPVMRLRTRLVAVRCLRRGEGVGYGGDYVAAADMRIGVAAGGYGDGYPRRNGLTAIVNGVAAPIIGRVSMNMLTLDLRNCAAAAVGDDVELWGETPSVDKVAAVAGTISYDLLTAVAAVPTA